jgi:hypothetical protein
VRRLTSLSRIPAEYGSDAGVLSLICWKCDGEKGRPGRVEAVVIPYVVVCLLWLMIEVWKRHEARAVAGGFWKIEIARQYLPENGHGAKDGCVWW